MSTTGYIAPQDSVIIWRNLAQLPGFDPDTYLAGMGEELIGQQAFVIGESMLGPVWEQLEQLVRAVAQVRANVSLQPEILLDVLQWLCQGGSCRRPRSFNSLRRGTPIPSGP